MKKNSSDPSASKTISLFKRNRIGVIPTDTIYGVAASAWSKKTVERAYKIMKRNPKKPFIILISSTRDLTLFSIKIDSTAKNILKKIWPGKVSVILPIKTKKFEYLHRGTKTLAFRVPKKKSLINLIKKTGPLISSSANPESIKSAETIAEAKKYFGNKVDFYTGGGKMKSLPSSLVEIKSGRVSIMREGSGKIPKKLLENNQ
ncbi:MAG: threonylcarbamoyl-AMP synthase [Candidatus Moranbacteria bacterium RIFOXYB1_FULL_43_19]|nr:MAG: threonylcarbamoyl-AMP synthase [Candidatus Moranbacteria bacterium RIFOXYB1_FULL_43_19]OGI28226.1 MAG: threonylcarbamoyl-AMP synthase [Candidatus Moranbacteria bacterium RIFOXYA1_FULL_44_7]OGI33676.1 MAG: threonylcarbamoyl-AMP synthase [Candidatus Moranbacteria bacterium RIFOXYC1_FULL_44_13]OGI37217.1 MAG: threonylcarbamoyl-AMP synthase [Candidatus Moranbacteria bacterium RIFOXYD1_FULL_44_12]